jgi:hypothetical protein
VALPKKGPVRTLFPRRGSGTALPNQHLWRTEVLGPTSGGGSGGGIPRSDSYGPAGGTATDARLIAALRRTRTGTPP